MACKIIGTSIERDIYKVSFFLTRSKENYLKKFNGFNSKNYLLFHRDIEERLHDYSQFYHQGSLLQ